MLKLLMTPIGLRIDSLRTTGKLPNEYITEKDAISAGWKRGKALNNYVPGKKYGGDVFKNDTNVLPDAQGRIWNEADVGLDYTRGRNNNPGYRILYSNDGNEKGYGGNNL